MNGTYVIRNVYSGLLVPKITFANWNDAWNWVGRQARPGDFRVESTVFLARPA